MKKRSKYYYYGEPESKRARLPPERQSRPISEKMPRQVSEKAARPSRSKMPSKAAQKKKQGLFSRLFKGSPKKGMMEEPRYSAEDGQSRKYVKDQDEGGQFRKDLESKISTTKDTGELIVLFKEIITDLRKENEELRKDRQFFLEHMKDIVLSESANKREGNALEDEEDYSQETEKPEKERAPEKMSAADRQSGRRIETSLDSLLDIIMKKGTVKVSDAARQLKVREKQIEEWAHVLEEHDIIEIHYPTMGKPLLKKKV